MSPTLLLWACPSVSTGTLCNSHQSHLRQLCQLLVTTQSVEALCGRVLRTNLMNSHDAALEWMLLEGYFSLVLTYCCSKTAQSSLAHVDHGWPNLEPALVNYSRHFAVVESFEINGPDSFSILIRQAFLIKIFSCYSIWVSSRLVVHKG